MITLKLIDLLALGMMSLQISFTILEDILNCFEKKSAKGRSFFYLFLLVSVLQMSSEWRLRK